MAVELAAAPWPVGGGAGGVSPTQQPGSAQCWPASGALWGSGAGRPGRRHGIHLPAPGGLLPAPYPGKILYSQEPITASQES